MTEDTSPENLRKFLESDDPALVMMGLSMSKGIDHHTFVQTLQRVLTENIFDNSELNFVFQRNANCVMIS